MTKKQQRIAIAGWMGWRLETSNVHDGNCWHLNGIQSEDAPPIYHEDLNAMHEAEKKLQSTKASILPHEHGVNLLVICQRDGNKAYWATASQRSEALCRTLWPVRFETRKGEV